MSMFRCVTALVQSTSTCTSATTAEAKSAIPESMNDSLVGVGWRRAMAHQAAR